MAPGLEHERVALFRSQSGYCFNSALLFFYRPVNRYIMATPKVCISLMLFFALVSADSPSFHVCFMYVSMPVWTWRLTLNHHLDSLLCVCVQIFFFSFPLFSFSFFSLSHICCLVELLLLYVFGLILFKKLKKFYKIIFYSDLVHLHH